MQTEIQIHKPKLGFSIIPNSIIRDTDISPEARILLITLISLPDDWNVNVKGLIKIMNSDSKQYHGFGRDGIYALLKELIANGYVVKESTKHKNGKFKKTIYHVFQNKCDTEAYVQVEDEVEVIEDRDEHSDNSQNVCMQQNIEVENETISECSSLSSKRQTKSSFEVLDVDKCKNHCTITDSETEILTANLTDLNGFTKNMSSASNEDFGLLCKISQNKNKLNGAGLSETVDSFEDLLRKGCSSKQVLVAWHLYQSNINREPKFMPQLCKWLSNEAEDCVKSLKNNTIDEVYNNILKLCGDKRFKPDEEIVLREGFYGDQSVTMRVKKSVAQDELNQLAKKYFDEREE